MAEARIRVVQSVDVPALYEIATAPESSYRWKYCGAVPPIEKFAADLFAPEVLASLTMLNSDGTLAGLAQYYAADLHNQHIALGILTDSDPRARRGRFLAIAESIEFGFRNWNLRKMYLESAGFNFVQFASGEGRFFDIEARIPEHQYFDGRFWPKIVAAIYRDRHRSNIQKMAARLAAVRANRPATTD